MVCNVVHHLPENEKASGIMGLIVFEEVFPVVLRNRRKETTIGGIDAKQHIPFHHCLMNIDCPTVAMSDLMTPEIITIHNGVISTTIEHRFCGNIDGFWKERLCLKLNGNSHQILIRRRNGPEDLLLWQIECARQHIVEPFMDRILPDLQ